MALYAGGEFLFRFFDGTAPTITIAVAICALYSLKRRLQELKKQIIKEPEDL